MVNWQPKKKTTTEYLLVLSDFVWTCAARCTEERKIEEKENKRKRDKQIKKTFLFLLSSVVIKVHVKYNLDSDS